MRSGWYCKLALGIALATLLSACAGDSTGRNALEVPAESADSATSATTQTVSVGHIPSVTTWSGYSFDLDFEIDLTKTPTTSVTNSPPGEAEVTKPQFDVKATLTNTTSQRNLPTDAIPRFIVKALWLANSKMCTTDNALGVPSLYMEFAQLEAGGCADEFVQFGWYASLSPESTGTATSEMSDDFDSWDVPENVASEVMNAASRPDGYVIEVFSDPRDPSTFQDVQSPVVVRCSAGGIMATMQLAEAPVIWASSPVLCIPPPPEN